MGAYASVTATTKLYLTITNDSATAVDHVMLNSAITPAGFGFFVADPDTGDINKSVLTTNANEQFSSFTPSTDGANLAGASYTFKITKGATASDPRPRPERLLLRQPHRGFHWLGHHLQPFQSPAERHRQCRPVSEPQPIPGLSVERDRP